MNVYVPLLLLSVLIVSSGCNDMQEGPDPEQPAPQGSEPGTPDQQSPSEDGFPPAEQPGIEPAPEDDQTGQVPGAGFSPEESQQVDIDLKPRFESAPGQPPVEADPLGGAQMDSDSGEGGVPDFAAELESSADSVPGVEQEPSLPSDSDESNLD